MGIIAEARPLPLQPLQPRAAAIVAWVCEHQAELEQIGPFELRVSGGPPGQGELSFWLSKLDKRRPIVLD